MAISVMKLVGAHVSPEMVQRLDDLRARLQEKSGGRAISRSEALRYCIQATTNPADLPLQADDEERAAETG